MKLVTLTAAWVAGLLLGLEFEADVLALVLFSLAAITLAFLAKCKGLSLWVPFLMLVTLMGLLRVELSQDPFPLTSSGGSGPVKIRGQVISDPQLSGQGVEFTISVDSVDWGEGWEEARDRILVMTRPPRELLQTREEPYFRHGDQLELSGRLGVPPVLGNFDYGSYLANQGIHSIMTFPQEVLFIDEGRGNPALGRIYDLRRRLAKGIDRALPEPQASLAQALLLGIRGRLPADVTEDFRSTGTSHLLAISGLHVGVLLGMSVGVGAWLMGRRRQVYLLLPLGAVWAYALLSGFATPVERVAIMGSVYLLAMALGRPGSILPALALAAACIAGLEPQALKQVSFQLSFAAISGIAMLTAYHQSPLWNRVLGISERDVRLWGAMPRSIVVALAISLAATLATLPLIAFNFHRIPTLGIPATIMALPALPFLLVSSGAAAVVGAINAEAGEVVGWVAWVPLEYLIGLVQLLSKVPGSTISVPSFSGSLVWAYYGALAILLLTPGGPRGAWMLVRRSGEALRHMPLRERVPYSGPGLPLGVIAVAAVGMAVIAVLFWYNALTGTDGRLHVHFLDVGQGDSIFIVSPEGRQVLVDGGPGVEDAVQAIGKRLKFSDRDLDLVVLTHPDQDHFRGLTEVLDRYDVEVVLESGVASENPLYIEWEKALETEDAVMVKALPGQKIALDGGAKLEVLSPSPGRVRGTGSDRNNNGVVVRLVYGSVSFLLTADIEAEAENRLLLNGLPVRSSVLKVAHHGSKTSTTAKFLATVNPVAAVISAGAGNPYGHPHPDVTARLSDIPGMEHTYLTAERGDIEFITDGERLWVKTAR